MNVILKHLAPLLVFAFIIIVAFSITLLRLGDPTTHHVEETLERWSAARMLTMLIAAIVAGAILLATLLADDASWMATFRRLTDVAAHAIVARLSLGLVASIALNFTLRRANREQVCIVFSCPRTLGRLRDAVYNWRWIHAPLCWIHGCTVSGTVDRVCRFQSIQA